MIFLGSSLKKLLLKGYFVAAWGYEFYRTTERHFQHEQIKFILKKNSLKEPAACLSVKLSCNWFIMLVTMATPISSHVKGKNSIFTARD